MFDDEAGREPKQGTILVAEDKVSMAEMLSETLGAEGYDVMVAHTGAQAMKMIRESKIDLVLTDLRMPRKNGIEVLRTARAENPPIPVILMTAFGSIETAVEAMRYGAYDFVTKPFDTGHLLIKISQALESQRLNTEYMLLKEEFSSKLGFPRILGRSPAMVEAAAKVQKVAPTRTTVLLQGESGTGKELFARAIHQMSPRSEHPFVAVNCAAIPGNLLESELFGHEKGAFTGADQRRVGKFELANRGTLFLDEIGELDLGLQAKLLRVLQEGEVERVGGTYPIPVDVRVLAASNRDLQKASEEGEFREDLFYRLNVLPIRVPPLRERKEDIPLLVEHFVNKYGKELGCPGRKVGREVLRVLEAHPWKGNVRELENTIERAMILCDGNEIRVEHLALTPPSSFGAGFSGVPMDGSLEEATACAVRLVEKERIARALKEAGGNKSKAAELLSVSYKTLLGKIKEHGLN